MRKRTDVAATEAGGRNMNVLITNKLVPCL